MMEETGNYLENMKDCSRASIDEEKNNLVNLAKEVISKFQSGERNQKLKELAELVRKEINTFRMKLAYDRGTEFLEGDFNWTAGFDYLTKEMESVADAISQS